MEQTLTAHGHQLVDFESAADVYIINTCTVTAVSDKKSRQMIRRARRQNPEAVVAVCGCFAQLQPQEVQALGADVVSGTANRMDFLRLVEEAVRERKSVLRVDNPMDRRTFEVLPAGGLERRTRAMLKVEDGCTNFCSYCIIPYARGPVRSLPLAEAGRQAKKLAEAGYREITLTGIEISSYGRDLPGRPGLAELIETVAEAAPDVRLRLGSLEPRTVTEEFCRRASALPSLCPHFHLSLQSGCDATLRRMNRKYTAKRYQESLALLREAFPRPAITTDLIVGFPQETEEEFAQTLHFVEQCAFAEMHIFPYSLRTGTPAASMPQVDPEVKEERCHRAARLSRNLRDHYLTGCIGNVYPVLFEQPIGKGRRWVGHAPNYCPVTVRGSDLHNLILPVKITGVEEDVLTGEIL